MGGLNGGSASWLVDQLPCVKSNALLAIPPSLTLGDGAGLGLP